MKKLCSILLAVLLAIALPVSVMAEDYTISGDFVITTDNPDCYTVENNTVTFHDGAEVTLSGNAGNHRLAVDDGAEVTITLNNFTAILAEESWSSTITLNGSASATIILAEGTTNNLTAGRESSAIRVPQDATLTITGSGTLNAGIENGNSLAASAVIGSQYAQSYGDIYILGGTINFDFNTTSYNRNCAAIGTGIWGTEGTDNGIIVISNATLDCGGLNIGGINQSQYSNVIIDNATVNNSNIMASAIVGVDDNMTVNGNITLNADYEIAPGKTLTIPEGVTFTVAEGVTLTNNGTIVNNGTIANNGIIVIEQGGVLSVAPGTALGTLINRGQVKYDSTQLTYNVAPTYTVTIPEKVTLGETATISAEDVIVAKGSQVEVALTGTSDDGEFTLATDKGAELTYTVEDSASNEVSLDSTVLTVNPEFSSTGSATLSFIAPDDDEITYAGEYKGTVTFTVSVETVQQNP